MVNVYINKEKNFAFVEFRTGELWVGCVCVWGVGDCMQHRLGRDCRRWEQAVLVLG